MIILDYPDIIKPNLFSYNEKSKELINKFDNILLLNLLSNIYNINKFIIIEFKKIYGYYPRYNYINNNRIPIEIEEQKLLNIQRCLKINKIIKNRK